MGLGIIYVFDGCSSIVVCIVVDLCIEVVFVVWGFYCCCVGKVIFSEVVVIVGVLFVCLFDVLDVVVVGGDLLFFVVDCYGCVVVVFLELWLVIGFGLMVVDVIEIWFEML